MAINGGWRFNRKIIIKIIQALHNWAGDSAKFRDLHRNSLGWFTESNTKVTHNEALFFFFLCELTFLKNSLDSLLIFNSFAPWNFSAFRTHSSQDGLFTQVSATFELFTSKFHPKSWLERHSFHLSDHLIRFTLSYKHDKRRCASVEQEARKE